MANGKDIQVEDGGFTRVHNAILENLAKAHLSGLEFQIVWMIIRKTYGFQKKMDVISISQFQACGCSRQKTIDAIKNLLRLKVILREKAGRQGYSYGFNKYIETWLPEVFQSRYAGNGYRFHKQTSNPTDTSHLTETSNPTDTRTSHLTDTRTSHPRETHKRKKEIKETLPENISEDRKAMFSILTRICKLDKNLKRGQINKMVKSLLDAGYLPSDLENFETWWKENDFRGQRGDPPTLGQVIDKILQAKEEFRPSVSDRQPITIILPSGEVVEAKS